MSHKYPPLPPSTRWCFIVTQVKRTFFENGERYYETTDGKIWDANVYDKVLVPPKLKVLPKNTPEQSINKSRRK